MKITIPTADGQGSIGVRVWWQYDAMPPRNTHETDKRRVTRCYISVKNGENDYVRYIGATKRRVEHDPQGVTDKFDVRVARKNSFARAIKEMPLTKEQRELLWHGVLPLVVE